MNNDRMGPEWYPSGGPNGNVPGDIPESTTFRPHWRSLSGYRLVVPLPQR
jgi:hypothetical protein